MTFASRKSLSEHTLAHERALGDYVERSVDVRTERKRKRKASIPTTELFESSIDESASNVTKYPIDQTILDEEHTETLPMKNADTAAKVNPKDSVEPIEVENSEPPTLLSDWRQCMLCAVAFETQKALDAHYVTHQLIPLNFSKDEAHMKMMTITKADAKASLVCSLCSVAFVDKAQLQHHFPTHKVKGV